MRDEPSRLAQGLARALAPTFTPEVARRLAEPLTRRIRHPDDPEASVRWSPHGPVRGGRMMLERLDLATVQWLADALSLPWPEPCARLGRTCERLGLPIIGGWDLGVPDRPIYKLYANASDAALDHGQALVEALGVHAPTPPHVIGLNVGRDRVDAKLYLQRRSRAELATAFGSPLPPLPSALAQHDVEATWVLSLDATPQHVTPRAVFVAAHHEAMTATEALLHALTGRTWSELTACFPFVPGPLRQLGWSVDGCVTVYAKPAGTTAPVHALAPAAVFATDDAEVGLYVEPNAHAPRAFLRTRDHALSFRVRAGTPDRAALERLGRWAQARLAATETHGAREDDGLDDPPPPWRRVPD